MTEIFVVGVDDGEPARRAARRAGVLAASLGARLHVVSAVEHSGVEEFPDRPGATLITSGEVAEATAADVVRELKALVPELSSSVVHDKPAIALVAEALRLDAQLIVIGNRRTQGVARVLGSVASSVVAHAPCDVYIVKTV